MRVSFRSSSDKNPDFQLIQTPGRLMINSDSYHIDQINRCIVYSTDGTLVSQKIINTNPIDIDISSFI